MWWWIVAIVVLAILPLLRVLASSHESDLGTVSSGWLARHKADRRSNDY